jgi:hypothetical protein
MKRSSNIRSIFNSILFCGLVASSYVQGVSYLTTSYNYRSYALVATIQAAIADAARSVVGGGESTINLTTLLGQETIDELEEVVPSSVINFFKKISITGATLTETVPQFNIVGGFSTQQDTGFTLTGRVNVFNYKNIPFHMYAVDRRGLVFALDLTTDFKFASIDSSLSALDGLQVGGLRLIISGFPYKDQNSGLPVQELGVNMLSYVDLSTEAMRNVRTFLNKLGPQFNLSRLNGIISIPITIRSSSFRLSFPIGMSVDFQQLYDQRKLKMPPTVIKNFTLSDPILTISPFNLQLGLEGGVVLGLTSQAAPLTFILGGIINPLAAAAYGSMGGMYSPAFGYAWLGLGNLTLNLGWVYLLMPEALAMGLPFTGINIGGTFVIGEGSDKTTVVLQAGLDLAPGKASISGGTNTGATGAPNPSGATGDALNAVSGLNPEGSTSVVSVPTKLIPYLGLYGVIDQLNLTALLSALRTMAVAKGKALNVLNKINLPIIQFSQVMLSVATANVTPQIGAGIIVHGNMNLLGVPGMIDMYLNPAVLVMRANGTLGPIITKAVTLSGMNSVNDPVSVSMGAGVVINPTTGIPGIDAHVYLDCLFSIPYIGLHEGLRLALDSSGFAGQGKLGFAGLDTMGTLKIPFDKFDNFLISFSADSALAEVLSAFNIRVHQELQQWSMAVQTAFNQKIGSVIQQITTLQAAVKTKRSAAAWYQQQCDQKGWIKGFEECVTAKTKGFDADINALNQQIQQLGVQVIRAAQTIPTALFRTIDTFIDLTTTIQINKISGTLTGMQVKALQLPSVEVELLVTLGGTVQTRTLQIDGFNLKDPITAAKQITQQIIRFISSLGTGMPQAQQQVVTISTTAPRQ